MPVLKFLDPCRELGSPQTACTVYRAGYQASPGRSCDSCKSCGLVEVVRLAKYRGQRGSVDHDSLASIGMAHLLAIEEQGRATADPTGVRHLIRRMAAENPLWGQEKIANELLVKLGIQVSPRTVAKYMPKRPGGRPRGDQRWSTFVRDHAKAILACDFFVAVTATFRMRYVFVVIEHGRRRLAHVNVSANPTADWTLQQLREVIADGEGHRYLIHDRDSFGTQISAYQRLCIE